LFHGAIIEVKKSASPTRESELRPVDFESSAVHSVDLAPSGKRAVHPRVEERIGNRERAVAKRLRRGASGRTCIGGDLRLRVSVGLASPFDAGRLVRAIREGVNLDGAERSPDEVKGLRRDETERGGVDGRETRRGIALYAIKVIERVDESKGSFGSIEGVVLHPSCSEE